MLSIYCKDSYTTGLLEEDGKNLKLTIFENDNFPAIVKLTKGKINIMNKAFKEHLEKLKGNNVIAYNELWLFSSQSTEIFLDFNESKQCTRLTIDNGSEKTYGRGKIYLDELMLSELITCFDDYLNLK